MATTSERRFIASASRHRYWWPVRDSHRPHLLDYAQWYSLGIQGSLPAGSQNASVYSFIKTTLARALVGITTATLSLNFGPRAAPYSIQLRKAISPHAAKVQPGHKSGSISANALIDPSLKMSVSDCLISTDRNRFPSWVETAISPPCESPRYGN